MWLAPNVVCVVVQLLVVVCSDGWSEARPSLVQYITMYIY